jgi:hypothetical protein
MDSSLPRVDGRALWALAALFTSAVMCETRHHVHILLSEPGTYTNLLHHKCGMVVVAAMAWVFCETVWLICQPGVPARAQ